MNYALFGIIFLFGTIIGSFLNVVIWRLPRGESLLGRSYCPRCDHTLSAGELFPILSFALQKRKCRHCKAKISYRYPLIETITGVLFALSWYLLQPETVTQYLLLAKDLLVIAVFIVVFIVDLEHYLILDNVIFPAGVAVLLINVVLDVMAKTGLMHLSSYFLGSLIGAAAAATPFFLLWYFSGGRWLGFGDVKLAIFLGVAFGWPQVWTSMFIGVLLGGVAAVFLLTSRKKALKSQVPFGTFLTLGGLVTLFWGERLLHWYLSLVGF